MPEKRPLARARHGGRRWVRRVRTVSTFPPAGLFTRDAATIARVMATPRVSPGGLGSAIRMVQFFINRGGKGLPASRRRELERAKQLLQDAAARERAAVRTRAQAQRRRRRRRRTGMRIAGATDMNTRPKTRRSSRPTTRSTTRRSTRPSKPVRIPPPVASHEAADRASQREASRRTRDESARLAGLERHELALGQLRPRIAARDNTQSRRSGRRVISTRARRRTR